MKPSKLSFQRDISSIKQPLRPGDIIEYIAPGLLSGMDFSQTASIKKIDLGPELRVWLDNGDFLVHNLHQIKRLQSNTMTSNEYKSCDDFLTLDKFDFVAHEKDQAKSPPSKKYKSEMEQDIVLPSIQAVNQHDISSVLLTNCYIKDPIIHSFIQHLRIKFSAQVLDTFFLELILNDGWYRARKCFKSSTDHGPLTVMKPDIEAEKLIIPIFWEEHWLLVVRFKIVVGESYYWSFLTIDSLNSDSYHSFLHNVITTKSKLHCKVGTMAKGRLKYQTDCAEFTTSRLQVKKQSELECGCRLALHMLIASMSANPMELQVNLSKLDNIGNLASLSRRWLHDVVCNDRSIDDLPWWMSGFRLQTPIATPVVTCSPCVELCMDCNDNEDNPDCNCNVDVKQSIIVTPINPAVSDGEDEDYPDEYLEGDADPPSDKTRLRSATGMTQIKIDNLRKKAKKEEAHQSEKRNVDNFFRFSATSKTKSSNFKKRLNVIYASLLALGRVSEFYSYNFHLAGNQEDCHRLMSNAEKKIRDSNKKNATKLDIKRKIIFMDLEAPGSDNTESMTRREFTRRECMLSFEHKMRTLNLDKCDSCLEYQIDFAQPRSDDKPLFCKNCTTSGYHKSNHYLSNNIQPVWYERNPDGSYKLDSDGSKIVRHDIPPELSDLTMAEKLLIRRYCPFVPAVHIKNGILGIKGHSICFPQDCNEVCNILPQLKCQVIHYVREVCNQKTENVKWETLTVRRSYVLSALWWLKRHNDAYKDIEIREDNLKWMNNQEECQIETEQHVIPMNPLSKRDEVDYMEENGVAHGQCTTAGNEDEFPMYTVQQNCSKYRPTEDDKQMIEELVDITKKKKNDRCLLDFPAVNNLEPIR